MLKTGLTSITFRKLDPSEIIRLVQKAGLDGIEWGGDIHAPPGDRERARSLRQQTEEAGLAVSSYGSYYRADGEAGDFADTLQAARDLGAPVIRVWAGRKGSAEAGPEYRAEVVQALRRAIQAASAQNIEIALEYHGQTLTDTLESAHQLLREVDRPELKFYWQPRARGTFENDLTELQAALPHLSHVHVFHWITGEDQSIDRRPFKEGVDDWREYLKLIREVEGDRYLLFEFVRDADPDQFLEDAESLRALLEESEA